MAGDFASGLQRRVERLADQFIGPLGVSSAEVYLLNTRRNTYDRLGSSSEATASRLRLSSDLATRAIDGTLGRSATAVDVDTGLVVVRHKRTPVAMIEFDDSFERTIGSEVQTFSEIVRQLFFQATVARVLEHMKDPIPFDVPRDAYLERLGSLILNASGTKYAALREIKDGTTLACVESWGFDPPSDRASISFPVDEYEPFELAFLGETIIESDIHRPGLEKLASLPGLEDVQSFLATPVLVGDRDFGVLSVATDFLYEFPQLHQLGIQALANAVGVSLSNFRTHAGSGVSLDDLADLTMMATGVEVAQAARHEIITYIDSGIGHVADIADELTPKAKSALEDELEGVSDSLLSASIAVDKIRLATKPPTFTDLQRVSLEVLWDEAIAQLGGRLDNLNINARINSEASKAYVRVYRGWFRQVFLHLILNSADAFVGKGRGTRKARKSGRQISLTVDKVGPKGHAIVARYSDNATGINPAELHGPDKYDDLPIDQQIFAPSVTSKSEGSGWGLYLVRRVLDEHGASIDLEHYRGGVTFRLTLPRAV